MRTKILAFLRGLLRGLLALLTLIAQGWRLWLATAMLGALLFASRSWMEPPLFASEAAIIIRPLFPREGYLLSATDLARNHAVRLRATGRVARVLASLDLQESPQEMRERISTWQVPGTSGVALRVLHPDPRQAERIVAGLLEDFRRELLLENRVREEVDRVVIDLSPVAFAEPANRFWQRAALIGFGAGLGLGLALVLLRALYRRGRILHPLEAEQLIGAPTLGAIPRRGPFLRR